MHLDQSLLLEHFNNGDARFADELTRCAFPDDLTALAERWKVDSRPFARWQILAYLARPLDRPGHEPIVKRLFKYAEAARDDQLMAAFAVAFDRLVNRVRAMKWVARRGARGAMQYEQFEALVAPRDRVRNYGTPGFDARTRQYRQVERKRKSKRGVCWRLFTYRTRNHLRRRVWRYFRRMGFQKPPNYVAAACDVLRLYRDDDFAAPENLLDRRTLLQIAYGAHDALDFEPWITTLKSGRSLAELTPAPRFPELWRAGSAFDALLDLAASAMSRPVRLWAITLLRRDHAAELRAIAVERLLALLDNTDEEVQQFGAELLRGLEKLPRMAVGEWLRALQTRNADAVATICELMAQHVKAERLAFEQCVDLCLAAPAPVARLGLDFLRQKGVASDQQRQLLRFLADTRCAAVAGELTRFALTQIGAPPHYAIDAIVGFFDGRLAPMRAAALEWLAPGAAGYDDPQLWARLIETPYDDVRLRLVELLERRELAPGAANDELAAVWRAVVLGVHRGGRQKPKAVRQLAAEISRKPEQAARLLPVLAVAVHSLRGPERRAGLAAIVALADQHPELAASISTAIPALRLTEAAPA